MRLNTGNKRKNKTVKTSLTQNDAEAIARLAPAYLLKINRRGKISYANRDFGKYPLQNLVGRSIYDFIDPEFHLRLKEKIKSVFSGLVETVEFSVTNVFSQPHHFKAFLGAVKDNGKGKSIKTAVFALLDITENKKVELALKESEARYKMLSDISFEGLIIYEGRKIIDCNNTFLEMSGYTREELIGSDILDLIYNNEGKKIFYDRNDKDNIIPYELIGISKKGDPYAIELQSRFFIQDNKKRKALAIRDISKRKEIEEELIKLHTAIEQSTSSIVITDTQGNIEYVNPAFCQTTGYSQEEVIGKNPRVLKTDYHPEEYYKELWSALLAGKVWTGEFLNKTKSGKLYWEKATISPVFDHNKKITHFLAIKENISVQKKASEALRESEERHRLISEMISDFVYKIDFDKDNKMKMSWTSGALKKITGYSVKEINTFKQSWSSIIHPEDRERIAEKIVENLNARSGLKIEYRIISKDGKIKWLTDSSKPIWDEKENKPIGYLGAVRDITERKETEAALMESEAKKNLILQKIPDLIFVFDHKGKFLNVYSETETDPLYQPEEFLNRYLYEIFPKDISDLFYANLQRALKTGEIQKFEYELSSKGEAFYYESRLIVSGKNEVVAIIRDITDRKKTEEQVKIAMREAEEANRLKSAFLANISHEIRTPINAVLGFAEILLSRVNKETNKRYLKSIISSGNTLLNLVNDILDLSKIEAGKMDLNVGPVNLKVLFEEINNIFCLQAEEKNLVYDFKISDQLPEFVELDEFRIRQVLLNLIDNAIKFTDEGFIKILVTVLKPPPKSENNRISLKIEVADSGIGIPKNDQNRLFTAFVQKDDQDKRKYGGTGLGLAITKHLTEMMGGSIETKSMPGVGTTFTLIFNDIKTYTNIEAARYAKKQRPRRKKAVKVSVRRPPSGRRPAPKSKDSADISPKTTSKERSELALFLNEIYESKWKETSKTASFSQIKRFAEEIGNLGRQYNSKNLLNFSNELFEYTENFDIDNIHALLKKFPTIIKNI